MARLASIAFIVATGCAPSPRAESAASSRTGKPGVELSPASSAAATEAAPQCELVCGRPALVRHEITPAESAEYYTNEAVEKANDTLNGMHDDLLACYTARVKVDAKAHAFLTVGIVVGTDGRVQEVETQGGALLGEPAMRCIVDRIKRGEFAPPPHGGTMRFEVPITLRRVGADETI